MKRITTEVFEACLLRELPPACTDGRDFGEDLRGFTASPIASYPAMTSGKLPFTRVAHARTVIRGGVKTSEPRHIVGRAFADDLFNDITGEQPVGDDELELAARHALAATLRRSGVTMTA